MPTPQPDETEEGFVQRCMGDDAMVAEFPDTDQRLAVCHSYWDEAEGEGEDEGEEGEALRSATTFGPGDLEVRTFRGTNSTRATGNTPGDGVPVLEGSAALFDTWTELWPGMRERIMPGFFAGAQGQDVRVLVNHDPNLLLGRTGSGTADLVPLQDGLGYRVRLDPQDDDAMRWHRRIARGDVDGCSFSFTVAKDNWYTDDDGVMCRDLVECGTLYDVGPVTFPAYPQTTVSARALRMAGHHWPSEPTLTVGDITYTLTTDTTTQPDAAARSDEGTTPQEGQAAAPAPEEPPAEAAAEGDVTVARLRARYATTPRKENAE